MIGEKIGQYRILEKLGEGGMGVVYKGIDESLDRQVAIKMLNPELSRDPQLMARFQAEAKAQAALNHTNIAMVYSFLEHQGNHFMVIEYVDGETLDAMIQRRGPIPYAEAIPIFKQALLGIGHAHRSGIIHRDIKPSNIMVNKQGLAKVMDFGIAKILGGRSMTRTGTRIGTLLYMSPEQIQNRPVDIRSDIYALGCTLYEMITGRVPFDSESDFQVMAEHVNTPPPRPTLFYPYTPRGLENAILKSLQKDPNQRFQTVEEFGAALDHPEDFGVGDPSIEAYATAPVTTPVPVGAYPGTMPGVTTPPPPSFTPIPASGTPPFGTKVTGTTPPPPSYPTYPTQFPGGSGTTGVRPKINPLVWVGAAVVLVVALGIGGFFAFRSGSGGSAAAGGNGGGTGGVFQPQSPAGNPTLPEQATTPNAGAPEVDNENQPSKSIEKTSKKLLQGETGGGMNPASPQKQAARVTSPPPQTSSVVAPQPQPQVDYNYQQAANSYANQDYRKAIVFAELSKSQEAMNVEERAIAALKSQADAKARSSQFSDALEIYDWLASNVPSRSGEFQSLKSQVQSQQQAYVEQQRQIEIERQRTHPCVTMYHRHIWKQNPNEWIPTGSAYVPCTLCILDQGVRLSESQAGPDNRMDNLVLLFSDIKSYKGNGTSLKISTRSLGNFDFSRGSAQGVAAIIEFLRQHAQ